MLRGDSVQGIVRAAAGSSETTVRECRNGGESRNPEKPGFCRRKKCTLKKNGGNI